MKNVYWSAVDVSIGIVSDVQQGESVTHISTLFLGREDPLEKEMAIHSSTLAWKIPWMEEPGRLQFMGPTKSRT